MRQPLRENTAEKEARPNSVPIKSLESLLHLFSLWVVANLPFHRTGLILSGLLSDDTPSGHYRIEADFGDFSHNAVSNQCPSV
jgi:hypothetical protein